MVHASEMAATTQGQSGWWSLVSVIRPLRARSHARSRWGSRDRLGSRSVIRRQLVVVSDRR